ncbi:uroporphyrinogen-III C-methyltransferase [Pollutimonas sp. H1-120]|uniref:uroporphyrinogen-III C-methyltransferase n=1 Tax=Pollutimonas sp. H1-120 TaxID=3148824 RepID=UPI003B52F83D
MTDKKPEITQAPRTAAPAATSSPGPATSASAAKKGPAGAAKPRSMLLPAFIVVLLIALALAAGLWYQQRLLDETRQTLTGQVQNSASAVNQAVEQAQQALSLAQEQSRKIDVLENSLRESQDQADSLEQAFQTLTDSGSDLVLINDVDHLVTIAQQQLQLSGNVANAVISLETAQAQLARANRPALASLQQALNGDLDRLRAASTIDTAMLSSQLEELGNLINEAPLLVPDDAAPEPVPAPQAAAPSMSADSGSPGYADPDAPWWKQGIDTAQQWSSSAWDAIRQDLGQFITVRRVDDATALLMSPDQAARFRETLRLRSMTAQLALLMHQPKVWDAETAVLVKALETRFDSRSQQVRQALKVARQLADTPIDVKLPTVDNSLQAIAALREASARQAEEGAIAAPGQPEPDTGAEPQTDPAAPATESAPDSSTGASASLLQG